jgi:hypothetical protein
MADSVYLHIGVPKSGTTFVRAVLQTNVERLRELGYGLTAASRQDLVHAAADLAGRRPGGRTAGAWDRQARLVANASGAVVLSQELLCLAGTEQAGRAVRSLGTSDVTIVLTSRDLARQITSYWQQRVKARFTGSLADMVDAIVDGTTGGGTRTGGDFWARQDLLAIADHWLAHLPADRVVVVTVPPAGHEPEILWHRFATACNLDPSGFDQAVDRPNESLGSAQAELLRRVNVELGDRLPIGAGYFPVVRTHLANDLLARQPHHEPYGLTPEAHAWATTTARGLVAGLQARGVRVVGDLDDLVPEPWQPSADPAAVDEDDLGRSAVTVLADLLVEWRNDTKSDRGRPRGSGARRHGPSADRR